jgi:dTDP-4-dehydrorhamnose 3,5-epimerase-like enzyme
MAEYKCISGPMHIIYVTSGVFDRADEIRIPYDDMAIEYDWITGFSIK